MAKRLQYSEDAMKRAIEAVNSGVSIRKATKTFGVPKSTLTDKKAGKTPIERKMGPTTILSAEEEDHLVLWILSSAKAGFPITKTQLADSVQLLVRELKRENPFPNDLPSRHWYENFLKRHPQITKRVPQNLSGLRADVSEMKIRRWFEEVAAYLKDHNLNIEEPNRIYNCDETAMSLCPKGEKVLTEKGEKTVYTVSNNDEKESLTTLFMCNAAGQLLPPLIMYSYKRVPKAIVDKVPKTWGVGKSDSGWMTGQSFFEYIANMVIDHISRCNCGQNWRWPAKEDVLNYQREDVIIKIEKPKIINKRGVYAVPELKDF